MFLRKDRFTYEDALQIDGLVKAGCGQEIQETQNSCKGFWCFWHSGCVNCTYALRGSESEMKNQEVSVLRILWSTF